MKKSKLFLTYTSNDNHEIFALFVENVKDKKSMDPYKLYPELFTGKVGTLRNYSVHLDVDPSAKPVQQYAYKIPYALHD